MGLVAMTGMGPMITHLDLSILLRTWRFSPWAVVATLVVALAGFWYYHAVSDLADRDLSWPRTASASWAAGLAVVWVAWSSSIGVFGTISFPVQVTQLLLLGLVAPPLLAFGAPLSLAWYAGSRRTRRRLLRWRRQRWWVALSHPAVAWVTCLGGFLVVLATPVIGWVLRHQPMIDVVGTALLASGMLLWWPVVGADPVPVWRRSWSLRLTTLLLAVCTFAVAGLSLVLRSGPVAVLYSASDTRAGGVVVLIGAQLVVVAGLVGLGYQWARTAQVLSVEPETHARDRNLADAPVPR
jgi:putative copper resistance protein D